MRCRGCLESIARELEALRPPREDPRTAAATAGAVIDWLRWRRDQLKIPEYAPPAIPGDGIGRSARAVSDG